MKKILIIIWISFFTKNTYAQNVGIGTILPSEKLDVAGNINITGSIKANGVDGSNGQVLKSNGDGTMSWTPQFPTGNIVFSKSENNPNLLSAGYNMTGKTDLYSSKSYLGTNSGTWSLLSNSISQPSSRLGHTAIWTGTEMIIWGGTSSDVAPYPATTDFRAIYKYNPTTNIWTKITTFSGTPPAFPRTHHSAIWTGTEMIIWGGAYKDVGVNYNYNDGYRYNVATNTWTAFTGLGTSPGTRIGHSAVWTGTEMLIWGGGTGLGGRYNNATNTWSTLPIGPSYVVGKCAVWTGTDMIIWGGNNSTRAKFNPVSNTWAFPIALTPPSSYPDNIQGSSAVWTGAQMIFWGSFASGGTFNPTTGICTYIGNTPGPPPTYNNSAVWTGTQMIVFGGTYQSLPWAPNFVTGDFWKFQFAGTSKSYTAAGILPLYIYEK